MHFACSCMESLREPLLEAQLDREAHTSQNSPLWNFARGIMVSCTSSFPHKNVKVLSTFSFMRFILDYSISYPGASAQTPVLLSLKKERR